MCESSSLCKWGTKQESVKKEWRKAEMETLLNPETTEEWRHDIRNVHNTGQHEHKTIYTENNKHRQSMMTYNQ